jgi:signal transduction histidine kinase
MFFSSIAHELRTPLNSIIPMIRMILTNFLSSIDDRVKNYLQIILNSSLHLQNVIEDALDMSRIENNKFNIFKELFDIRAAVNEVTQIMEFQI